MSEIVKVAFDFKQGYPLTVGELREFLEGVPDSAILLECSWGKGKWDYRPYGRMTKNRMEYSARMDEYRDFDREEELLYRDSVVVNSVILGDVE